MIAVFGQDQMVAEYVSAGIGDRFVQPYVCIGFTRDNKTLCGGALFNDWNGSNIEISIFAPGAFNRIFIATCCRYTFRQIGANRMTGRTRRNNKTMQRLFPRIGFIFEGAQKRYYGPDRQDDALLYALYPAAAEKWIR